MIPEEPYPETLDATPRPLWVGPEAWAGWCRAYERNAQRSRSLTAYGDTYGWTLSAALEREGCLERMGMLLMLASKP